MHGPSSHPFFSLFLSLYVNVTQPVLKVPVFRTAGTFGTISVIYYIISQNAINGTDYVIANYLDVSDLLLLCYSYSGSHCHDRTVPEP